MYNEIKDRLQKRLAAQPRFTIGRISAPDASDSGPAALLSEHVAKVLAPHRRELAAGLDSPSAETTLVSGGRFGGFHTQRQLEDHVVERVITSLSDAPTAFDFTVPSGTSVVGTPYDRDYSQGSGIGFLARFDGKVITLPGVDGFSGAGVGLYLTSD